MIKHRFDSSSWRLVIDPKLLPFLLSPSEGEPRTWPRWLVGMVGLLSIMALAGPTWDKLPQPVFSTQAALVIALDLSRSMDATDIRPSRLTRARHKIADILHQRKEGQTALVVYADAAFTVTPLTDDVETILALLPSLDSDIMPAQGSRAERAFALALELFANSGVLQGDVLLVSDGTGDSETMQIEAELLRNPDFRLSVLAIGTREGGPIPITQGGFLKDATGSIVIARLQENNLRQIAKTGNGAFAALSSDDRDINTLVYAMEPRVIDQQAKLSDSNAEIWRELGPWLILLIIPLAALSFRRGVLWLMPLYMLALPPDAQALEWESLWKNQDHRAGELFEQGDFAAAAELFQNPAWKASAQYRAGEYQVALDQWLQLDNVTSLYNRGNALAKLGQYEKAIAAYQQLLQSNPQHEDAIYNKKQLEDLLQNQPQKGSDPNSPNSENDKPGSDPNSQSQAGSDPEPQGEGSDPGHQDNATGSDPLKEQGDTKKGSDPSNGDQQQSLANLEQQMSDQAAEQWLRKIPDDPGGLLRRKFLYQYRKRGDSKTEGQNW
jgi:Ca-activated chloride channel family protein